MSDFIINILDKVQQYSHSLQKQSMYTNKPWALVDNDLEIQKMIFKNNNELILSKNGKVQIGHWEHLIGTKSILIDRGNDKLLLNEVFLNEDVMILKLDGTKHDFFVFANENTVPHLDIISYFDTLALNKKSIRPLILKDKRVLKMYYSGFDDYRLEGKLVRMDNRKVTDGMYETTNNYILKIVDSTIQKKYSIEEYNTIDGKLKVYVQEMYMINTGEIVYLNNELIQGDKIIDFSKRKRLIIKNGKVKKLEWKNPTLRKLFG
ncbi:MAG: hypothetical protein AB8G11_05965 [Saprospiraceae bacterium]